MTITTMYGLLYDPEEAQASLEFIKGKMKEIEMLVHNCKAHFGIPTINYINALGHIQDAMHDMLAGEWDEAYHAAGLPYYTSKIPNFTEVAL